MPTTSKYTEAQRAFYRKTHRDAKGGSLRGGDATVLRQVAGMGTCAVNLEHVDGDGNVITPRAAVDSDRGLTPARSELPTRDEMRAAFEAVEDQGELGEGPPEVRRFLDCSLTHVHATTRELLEEESSRSVMRGLYGWLLHVPDDPPGDSDHADTPDDLLAIFAHAREHGCAYVLLDADGPFIPILPTYNDD